VQLLTDLHELDQLATVSDNRHFTPRWCKATPVLPHKSKEVKTAGATFDGHPSKIRCPLCKWQPTQHDRWLCECGYEWNTFDTHGVCPNCHKQWLVTACLACGEWSPHEAWYVLAEEQD